MITIILCYISFSIGVVVGAVSMQMKRKGRK